MNVGFSTQISVLGIFSIICNTEWKMTFHYISILFYNVCLSKGAEILDIWNATMRTSKYAYCVLYHHDINDVFSLRKIKRFIWFFFFRALKQRIRYWLNRIHHELWCYLKRVCDFSSKEEKGGEWMGWDAEACCRSCCDPEPWPLCRTADCEGQYNPQCLMLQWLIKYLMY